MTKLKPCPFCGGEASIEIYESSYREYSVGCTKCPACLEEYYCTEHEAEKQWNRRVNDAAD